MRQAFKETIIFLTIFIVLSLGMHMEKWLSTPITHFSKLFDHVMPWHPAIYVMVVYLLLGSLRIFLMGLKYLLTRN